MATDANNDDGPQLTELESLQLKANNITDDSLESTRRMISLCEDSEGAGMSSIQALEHQGEQLNRIENGMDGMNAEMAEAEKHLIGMEKWCGLCVCPWKRTAKIRDSDGQWAKGANSPNSSKPISSQPKSSDNINSNKGPYVKRILNDAREDEMEDNLQSVGNMLGNLKNMAADMGSTIENQNKQIDRINVKGSTVDTRIHIANKRTDKLLN
uniref:Synaptosomal-associated protein n=1 Tax=Lepeophtheirus salmonis TaxID=72036 RepID=D3PJP8_LEPSM|nr:Synaptosomal-associated protein 25 [Lepeophtheirus salmonis]